MARILLVEDDQLTAESQSHVLRHEGFTVDVAPDGACALNMMQKRGIGQSGYDVIVSDIHLPHTDGMTFLQKVRTFNQDIPFIFTTGAPCLETAIMGINHGIAGYMIKPVDNQELVSKIREASQLHALARLQQQALLASSGLPSGNLESLTDTFESALGSLWVAFQPIVSWRKQKVYAYEALVRNNEPALARPPELLSAASRLGRQIELGRTIRGAIAEAIRSAQRAGTLEEDTLIFVNLDPIDLNDPELCQFQSPLSPIAERVVFEITERDSLQNVNDLQGVLTNLRQLGFRVAIDDLGQGHAGLNTFVRLKPDFVKLDMSLIRGISEHVLRQQVVRSMVSLCRSLEILPIAEGVETVAERDTLLSLSADLLQGYLFARPSQAFVVPHFAHRW